MYVYTLLDEPGEVRYFATSKIPTEAVYELKQRYSPFLQAVWSENDNSEPGGYYYYTEG
jgi:hypothetical protein